MGQAQERGTFDQRQQAAYDGIDAAIPVVTPEEASDEAVMASRRDSVASQIIVAHWKYSDIAKRISAFAPLNSECFAVSNNFNSFNMIGH